MALALGSVSLILIAPPPNQKSSPSMVCFTSTVIESLLLEMWFSSRLAISDTVEARNFDRDEGQVRYLISNTEFWWHIVYVLDCEPDEGGNTAAVETLEKQHAIH